MAELPGVLDRCKAVAAQIASDRDAHQLSDESAILLQRVPPLVRAAQARRRVEAVELTARKRQVELKESQTKTAQEEIKREEAAVESLERSANEAELKIKEARSRLQTRKEDTLRRMSATANATADLDGQAQRIASSGAETKPVSLSNDTLLRRIVGEMGDVVKPVLLGSETYGSAKVNNYEFGKGTIISIRSENGTGPVDAFRIDLGGRDIEGVTLGLMALMNAIDVANPGLSQNERDDIAEPIAKSVVQNGQEFRKALSNYDLHCVPTNSHATCTFKLKHS